jgi:hypothetical protein
MSCLPKNVFGKITTFGRNSNNSGQEYLDEEPPTIVIDSKLSTELYRRLSLQQTPVLASPDEATVNVNFSRRPASAPAPTTSNHDSTPPTNMNTMERLKSSAGFKWSTTRKNLEIAIAVEQLEEGAGDGRRRSSMAWELEGVAAAEQRLALRLHKLKLDMLVMCGDGNCQFRSIAYGLYGDQGHHHLVRQRVISTMAATRSYYEGFLGDDFNNYLNEMSRSGVWGDELTLRAAAEHYGIAINVITDERDNWFVRYVPQTCRQAEMDKWEIFLAYISPVHYNYIKKRSVGDALRTMSSIKRKNSRIVRALEEDWVQREALPANPLELAEGR